VPRVNEVRIGIEPHCFDRVGSPYACWRAAHPCLSALVPRTVAQCVVRAPGGRVEARVEFEPPTSLAAGLITPRQRRHPFRGIFVLPARLDPPSPRMHDGPHRTDRPVYLVPGPGGQIVHPVVRRFGQRGRPPSTPLSVPTSWAEATRPERWPASYRRTCTSPTTVTGCWCTAGRCVSPTCLQSRGWCGAREERRTLNLFHGEELHPPSTRGFLGAHTRKFTGPFRCRIWFPSSPRSHLRMWSRCRYVVNSPIRVEDNTDARGILLRLWRSQSSQPVTVQSPYVEGYGERRWEDDILPAAVIEEELIAAINAWCDVDIWRRREREIERARAVPWRVAHPHQAERGVLNKAHRPIQRQRHRSPGQRPNAPEWRRVRSSC